MSDTPRVDAVALRFPDGTAIPANEENAQYNDLLDLARTLERDLAAKDARIKELERHNLAWIRANAPGGWIDNLRKAEAQQAQWHYGHAKDFIVNYERMEQLQQAEADAKSVRQRTIAECADIAQNHNDSHGHDDIICGGQNCAWLIAIAIKALEPVSNARD